MKTTKQKLVLHHKNFEKLSTQAARWWRGRVAIAGNKNFRLEACMASQMVLVVKKPPANTRDPGPITGLERSLEEEMATYSSILARRIPWTEKPGRLQSMGLQRVGHD